MKRKINLILALVFLVAISLIPAQVIFSQDVEEETTIEGEVTPIDVDDEDNVTAVAISVTITPDDPDKEEYIVDYFVADNEKGKELLKHVGEKVKATGTVVEEEDGDLLITVTKYEVIKKER